MERDEFGVREEADKRSMPGGISAAVHIVASRSSIHLE